MASTYPRASVDLRSEVYEYHGDIRLLVIFLELFFFFCRIITTFLTEKK